MKRIAPWKRIKRKLGAGQGMTLAEVLAAVGILIVLSGAAFIAVWNYQRSMAQLERDGIAREIFVAAQNHLTAAQGQGYLGETAYGCLGTLDIDQDGSGNSKGVYYCIVTGGNASPDGTSAYELMLPFGSLDETVRTGGSYLIRYQPATATVLDVFYCSTSGSPARFNCDLAAVEGVYASVMGLRENKSGRRTYADGGNSVLGYYGGVQPDEFAKLQLEAPVIEVINGDTLYVTVTDPNNGKAGAERRLLITGELSKVSHYVTLDPGVTEYMLDDITAADGHFCQRRFDDMTTELTNGFIPGENITIRAIAYSATELANVAYSAEKTTNSLFAEGTTETAALITSIRHLENLDKKVSNLDANDAIGGKLNLTSAVQTADLNWTAFMAGTKGDNTTIFYSESTEDLYSPVNQTEAKNYYPISPDYTLSYDGKGHSISGVFVGAAGSSPFPHAGLFGSASSVTEIKSLELIDFSITGTTTAGALAGTLDGCEVTNVLARNSAGESAKTITAPTAGGLIGSTGTETKVRYSAAAVIVNGSTCAGGLIGSAGGTITGCYSGGHTKNGSYEEWLKTHACDVTGGTAGGLVGASSAAISCCYSTCSVSGTTAGGLAGSAAGSITGCYAAGYIDPASATKFAFAAGTLPSGSSGNRYYMAVNTVPAARPDETEPMLPCSGYVLASDLEAVKPIDLNAASYNAFVGAWDSWNPARAFDSALIKYYSGRYTLQTIDELTGASAPAADSGFADWQELFVTTHYGDWPSPEVFFINN